MPIPSHQSAAPLSKRSVERHLDHLPVLSNVAVQLMALDTRDPKYFDRVKRLIECEPAFVVRILSAANSARSAPRLPITTLNAALIRVGSTHAANLVLAAALSQVFVPQRDWQRGLWRHAIQVAVTGRALSSALGDPQVVPDEVYAAALLHDVGHFVLLAEAPQWLERLTDESFDTEPSLTAERAALGMDHAEVGALACKRWKLPELMVRAVRGHHEAPPLASPEGRLIAAIHVADLAAKLPADLASSQPERLQSFYQEHVSAFLPISTRSFEDILAAARSEAATMCEFIGVGAA